MQLRAGLQALQRTCQTVRASSLWQLLVLEMCRLLSMLSKYAFCLHQLHVLYGWQALTAQTLQLGMPCFCQHIEAAHWKPVPVIIPVHIPGTSWRLHEHGCWPLSA